MFRIPQKMAYKFKDDFEKHKMIISSMNIFFNNVRLLNNRHTYLDRDTYKKYFDSFFMDIELVTSPIDAIIPCDDNESDKLFVTNQIVPEYKKISEIMTFDKITETLPETHDVRVTLLTNPSLLGDIIDDIVIYFYVYRYLAQIDLLRLRDFSVMKDVIEFVVNSVSLDDIKSFLISRKINDEKYIKYCSDIIFNPDIANTQRFYSKNNGEIPPIDVTDLVMRLASNVIVKSDIYIIIGIYLVISFSITDIYNNKIDNSPNVLYVRDVLSKI